MLWIRGRGASFSSAHIWKHGVIVLILINFFGVTCGMYDWWNYLKVHFFDWEFSLFSLKVRYQYDKLEREAWFYKAISRTFIFLWKKYSHAWRSEFIYTAKAATSVLPSYMLRVIMAQKFKLAWCLCVVEAIRQLRS